MAGQPVIDPAGWEPEDLVASNDWIHGFDDSDIAEIDEAVAGLTARVLSPA